MMTRILVISLLELICTFAAGQVLHAEEAPKILTVCDILTKPLQFDGKMVTIRSRQTGTDEGLWLVGDQCPGVLVTEEHIWPSEISVALPGFPLHLHAIDFQFDAESQRRAESRYSELTHRVPA